MNVIIVNMDGLIVEVCSMFGADNKCIQKICQETRREEIVVLNNMWKGLGWIFECELRLD